MSNKTNEKMYPESELTLRDDILKEYKVAIEEVRADLQAANEKNSRLIGIIETNETEFQRLNSLIEDYKSAITERNADVEILKAELDKAKRNSNDVVIEKLFVTTMKTFEYIEKIHKRSGFLWWLNPKNW